MNESEVVARIEALEAQRIAATLAGQTDVLAGLLGDDLRYVHSSGTDETKAEFLARLASGHYVYKALESGHRDFRVFGDVVLVNGNIRIEVVSQGKDKLIQCRYLQAWAKRDGNWQMVAWQSTTAPVAM